MPGCLAWFATLPMASALFMRSAASPRRPLKMQYGDYDPQQSYDYNAPVVWSLSAFSGIRGFANVAGISGECSQVREMAADMSAMGGSAGSIYQQDYRYLPYLLRNGEEQVLSRWNMEKQKLTVSRVQCKIQVSADGTAGLLSTGKGPTLWRVWGGPWNRLSKGEWHILAGGDQLSLDWHDPEAAIVTCQVEHAQDYVQQDYAQPGYAQPGLPAGWTSAIDEASGTTYYYNQQSGVSQWEPPQQQGGY